MRSRWLTSRPAQPTCRRVLRRVLRHGLRRVPRRAPRRVLKDDGPSLHDLCNVVSSYLRLATAWDKKWNPPSRFKTLGTPEERCRQMEADLERAYGEKSPFARAQITSPPLAPASPPAPPLAPRQPSGQVSAPQPAAEPPRSQPPPKCDTMAVPLVRLPNGLLSLDWSRARPA